MDLPSPAQELTPEIRFLYGLRRGTTRLGLESTRQLLDFLGAPERDVPVVHVAGTNGKGSTTAYAAAMLQAAGLRVGRFTSPHILSVEERVCVDGIPIGRDEFAARVRALRPWIERAGASFFEAMTAIAASVFRDAGVAAAVYEVGLGGRLDATNALPVTVSVVTSIGHDHEAILGRGLRAVCAEKLGIVRAGVPLHAALGRSDLVRLARERCATLGAPLHLLPADRARVLSMALGGGMHFALSLGADERSLWTHFLGAHYAQNAALAAAATAEALRLLGVERNFDLQQATAAAYLPARCQFVAGGVGAPPVILDVAHNPEALQSTFAVLRVVLGTTRPVVILGMMRDKRLGHSAALLQDWARALWLTAPRVERAWNPQQTAARLRPRLAGLPVVTEPDACTALAGALRDGAPVIVIGSHYLVGEVVPFLAAQRGVPPQALVTAPAAAPVALATGR